MYLIVRTWLCGGRIVVARDSFVAHGFRTRFPYKVYSMREYMMNRLMVVMLYVIIFVLQMSG